MKNIPNGVLLMSAAGLTLAGVAVAGNLYLQPVAADKAAQSRLSTMRELAGKIGETQLAQSPLAVPAGPETPKPEVKKIKVAQKDPVKKADPTPIKPPTDNNSASSVKPDLVKNIALMGVTHEGGADQVWLVDTAEGRRETAAAGESAFGFRVKTISDDSVVLSKNGDEYTVRMGDKEIPTQTASADGGTLSGTDDAGGFGGGPGGPGGRGQFGGRGFGRGGFGGFNRGGFTGGYNGGASASNTSSNQFNRPNFGGFNRGGFGGGGFGGGFGGGINNNNTRGTSQFASGAAVTTSNPQTARRSGGKLVGGADAMPKPAAISNPQTTRRTGTSNTTAFGQASGTVAGIQQNNANGSRFGGYGTSVNRGN